MADSLEADIQSSIPVEGRRPAARIILTFLVAGVLLIGVYLAVPQVVRFKPSLSAQASKFMVLPSDARVEIVSGKDAQSFQIVYKLARPKVDDAMKEVWGMNLPISMATQKTNQLVNDDGYTKTTLTYDPAKQTYTYRKRVNKVSPP